MGRDKEKIQLMEQLIQLYQNRSYMSNTPEVSMVIDEYIEDLEKKLRKQLKHGGNRKKNAKKKS